MSDVDIVRRDAPPRYFLSHGYDTDLLEGVPCEGPYSSRETAEEAAAQLLLALSGTDG
ncbi:hypothetical protein [Planctomonas deserti]|jgi:hypothetical protein|uniref:hypothetical protein n=1 Tax=Planctomonas deserti TaxID=2144185 RepID=UPI00131F07A1|nr:hypothetical protein [Planctomonas deserti]